MVDGVYWENVVRWVVFVDTWGGLKGIIVGRLEGKEWNGRYMIETHCYLMTLPSFCKLDETKEMSGEER